MENCGFSMRDGRLLHNCTGFFTTVSGNDISLHDCSDQVDAPFRTVVEVFHKDCVAVLLSYDKSELAKSSVYPFVLWPTIMMLLLSLMGSCFWLSFSSRIKLSKGSKLQRNRKGIKVIGVESDRFFTWKEVLLICLCFRSVIAHTCVDPHLKVESETSVLYTFRLDEREAACFDEGLLVHTKSREALEISFLYNTTEWTHFIWSEKKCGTSGDCGTVSECGIWGAHGKIVGPNHEIKRIYKKICAPHNRGFFVCPNLWGCWLATLEVFWSEGPLIPLFEIGGSVSDDEYEVHGLRSCSIYQEKDNDSPLVGEFLVEMGQGGQFLCPEASRFGQPRTGELGDFQISGTRVDFDFSSFECELSSPDSTGWCKVKSPAIREVTKNCKLLPAITPSGRVWYENRTLLLSSPKSRSFKIRCPKGVSLSSIDHNCYSVAMSIHGVLGERQSTYLKIVGHSANMNSSMIVKSKCGGEDLIVACDGTDKIFKLVTDDLSCYDTYSDIVDERTEMDEGQWEWDNGNHDHPFESHHLGYATIVTLIIVALVLLKIFLH